MGSKLKRVATGVMTGGLSEVARGAKKTFTADPSAGAGAAGMSYALQERAVRELEKLGIPSIEAQEIVLTQPELVLSTLEERLGPSVMEDIALDPRLKEAQMQALTGLEEAGREGFTEEDRARTEALRTQIAKDEQARQASILQQMAQRGALDSGMQLAAQLGSSQAATQRGSEAATQMAGQQAAARRAALAQAGQLGGQIGQQQFGQQAQQAQAADAIARFNAGVAARDTAARQQHAQQAAQLANQQQMYNKALIQQDFQNRLAKATGMTGALSNQAQSAMQQAQMQAQAEQQRAAGMRGLLTGAMKAGATAYGKGKADGGVKYSNGGFDPYAKSRDKAYLAGQVGKQQMEDLLGLGKEFLNNPLGRDFDSSPKVAPEDKDDFVGPPAPKKQISGSDVADVIDAFEPEKEDSVSIPSLQAPMEDIGAKIAAVRGPDRLAELRQRIVNPIAAADGGMKGMNYEAGGEGTIIDSGEENFAGDELEDRINDGEMVLNLDQQDHLVDLLQELAHYRRGDEMVDRGDAEINGMQQETLMNIARGEAQPEDLMQGEVVEREEGTEDIEGLLAGMEGEAFKYGGVAGVDAAASMGVIPENDPELEYHNAMRKIIEEPADLYSDEELLAEEEEMTPERENRILSTLAQQEVGERESDILNEMAQSERPELSKGKDLDAVLRQYDESKTPKPAETLSNEEIKKRLQYDTSKIYPDNTLGPEGTRQDIRSDELSHETGTAMYKDLDRQRREMAEEGVAPIVKGVKSLLGMEDKKEKEKTDSENMKTADKLVKKVASKEDTKLERARMADIFVDLLGDIDNALGHFDAANPNATLTPIQKKNVKSDLEASLLAARKIASDKDYKALKMKMEQDAFDFAKKKHADDLAEKEKDRVAKEKLEALKQKGDLTDKEKIKYKEQLKEETAIRKEQRKDAKEAKEGIRNIDEYVKDIDKAIKLTKKAQKEGGRITGPIAGRVPTVSKLGQEVEQAYARVSFANFVEKARGMSKAFDSEREREFYEKTQPSDKKDEKINLENLQQIRANILEKRGDLENRLTKDSSKTETKAKSVSGDTISIRRKSDGMTKRISRDNAQKYLSDPRFEEVK